MQIIHKAVAPLLLTTLMAASAAFAEPVGNLKSFFASDGLKVTPESYPTAETSHQLLKNQDLAGVNTFLHKRQLTPTDQQPVVRMNRDTYYSFAVIDVSKGASVTIPEVPEGKYVSVQPVTEDHRIQPMMYGAGTFDLKTHIGSHMYIVVRLDATLSEEEAAKIQDKMSIAANSDMPFMAEPVNEASFKEVETTLKAKMPGITKRDGKDALVGMFTAPTDESNKKFTQEKYEVGAAIGWGGAQEIDNIYEVSGNYPSDTCHQATFEDPKNKAFWSVTVYDKAGFMFNDLANLSSNTAKPNKDGTYTLSFGCGNDAENNIETQNDSGVFTLGVRHYQPSETVSRDGFRVLPTVKAVK
ncbi:hypothetical protein A3742_11210 [Oleiphilus sp. HI0071]|uniref:DUF1254 domain-containing protein n=1 Tax=Oleiphilus sp. HI0080 TaxID=1822255 RepID=UPI0007C24ED8|nr:DUF1254 domain-containing protein [Oleiphilus sp. HI0080]KZY62218.1 hypothetical protein A3737_04315 [Oleiphilus sp. HI0065]KZY81702.1 hypothetical protein A3742_11210 [Oleiphilus sp. HI0071]KZZ00842.1 hypothetical protein A3744_11930 [Oleiphilus sp. HI0073]KZZ48227.1 hypothetical protein A3760_04155 [Oleiphilus sp. HI0122]KZZ48430.1 hypothetical protein A3758_01620 [Oleiphilus sp. HI0118]KZZ79294.1 hypothetical protein A3767_11345 [Oleiphilus sp. HI0133]